MVGSDYMTKKMNKRSLIIDDSVYMRKTIKHVLENAGYEIVGEARTGKEGIDLAMELKPDLITLDNFLPDMEGIEILKVFNKEDIESKVIMISAVSQESLIAEGLRLGAVDYLIKPFSKQDLITSADGAIMRDAV